MCECLLLLLWAFCFCQSLKNDEEVKSVGLVAVIDLMMGNPRRKRDQPNFRVSCFSPTNGQTSGFL